MFNCVHVIIQLHWYRDKSIYTIYQNIIFHLKVHIFLLILKEINTFSWTANSLMGPRYHAFYAYCLSHLCGHSPHWHQSAQDKNIAHP